MSEFIVSARKYRPDTFDTVIGQRSTTSTLKNAIRIGHLAQAYLFCGPRGVGKTTCARILAKTINCQNLTSGTEACNECESCKSFNQNRSFNIHELDAASNNKVDDIRYLIEQVRIPPQVSRYSVYIIDEVHMLSQSAFNAFLKTLEEPPPHAVFILATTEKHKILPTILSRCQVFDFNRIKIDDIVKYLEDISKKENVSYEKEALNIIAVKSDGAMRDALSLFDQIVSFTGNKITYQSVIENLNILDFEYYFRLTDYFLEGKVPDSLLLFDEILAKGFDAHNFINSLSSHFRDLLVCKFETTVQLLESGESFRQKYSEQALRCSDEFIFSCIEICNECDISYKAAKNQRLHVELTLVKLANTTQKKKDNVAKEDVLYLPTASLKKSQKQKHEPENVKPKSKSGDEMEKNKVNEPLPSFNDNNPVKSNTPSIRQALENLNKRSSEKSDGLKEPDPENKNPDPVVDNEISHDEFFQYWKRYIESLKKEELRMYLALKSSEPVIENNIIALQFRNNAQVDDFKLNFKQSVTEYLRDNLKNNLIEINEIIIENESQPVSKFLTDIDKLKYMTEKNPAIQKLKQDFNLDFE
ncbi:MAG: DNA polymerase III subunit gamma/tau [Bacteroidales bacterium]|nr:DNA polymerase III subunit gamma/tau [Bacteroidales bacterium]